MDCRDGKELPFCRVLNLGIKRECLFYYRSKTVRPTETKPTPQRRD